MSCNASVLSLVRRQSASQTIVPSLLDQATHVDLELVLSVPSAQESYRLGREACAARSNLILPSLRSTSSQGKGNPISLKTAMDARIVCHSARRGKATG
jgi:hypothetical protein